MAGHRSTCPRFNGRFDRWAWYSGNAADDGANTRGWILGHFLDPLSPYAEVIAAFVGSRALADGAGTALHTLESSRQPLPPVILDLCEAFVRMHQDAIGAIATSAAADAMYVVRLALRMHAQHTEPNIRRRWLDLIDQLVVLGAHGLQARPIYHHQRDSIEAHLTIVFAALAVSRWIEHQTG